MRYHTLFAVSGLSLILAGPAFAQDASVHVHARTDQNELPVEMQEDLRPLWPSVDPLATAGVRPVITPAPSQRDVDVEAHTDQDEPPIEDRVNPTSTGARMSQSGSIAPTAEGDVDVEASTDQSEPPFVPETERRAAR